MKKLLSTLLFLFVVAIISISAQTKGIYPPALNDPGDEAINKMPDVILDWSAVVGSGGEIRYDLLIDTDASFATAVPFNNLELTGQQMQNLLFNQDYYWKVRASEGTDVSDWSAAFKFTTFEMLKLLKPNDGADEQAPDALLKLKSSVGVGPAVPISGIDSYDFQADTSMNFDSPLLWEGSMDTLILNTSFLHFGEVYYWRARAVTSTDISAWSELRTFEVIDFAELDEPGDGDADLGLEVEFTWDELSGITDYEFQLADNDAFTAALSRIAVDELETIDNFMTFGTDYWWRVRANHPTDTSGWSEAWKLTTKSVPELNLPADMATDVKVTPMLEWEELSGIDTFNVVYGATPGIENPIAAVKVEGSQFKLQTIIILDKGTPYYWKVQAVKGMDISDWSDTYSFTTVAEIGISEPFDKNNISIYPNPSSGTLHVSVSGEENTEVTIYIMDLLGQVHVEQSVVFSQGSTKSFDLSGLANGLYLVKLNRGDQSYTQKITIHK
jgi:hypothetical protein